MAYTATWDETTPAGSEVRSLGDDRIRELKIQLRERLLTWFPSITSMSNEAIHEFASGTKMVFFQSTAPTGWTQDTTHNDKTMRIVNSAGGGSGGTLALSSTTTGNHTLTSAEMPSHTHTLPDRSGSAGTQTGDGYLYGGWGASSVASAGSDGAHNHPLALSYVDVIICTKD